MNELREKIADLQVPESTQLNPKYRLLGYNLADRILALLREKIEKCLLTDEEITQAIEGGYPFPRHRDVAQAQLQKILACIKEEQHGS